MTEHPYDLLAEHVEGALGAEDRAHVEAHLRACDACRGDVERAGEARRALASLPEAEEPADMTLEVLRRARAGRPVRWAGAGKVAAIAAAALLVFGGFGYLLVRGGDGGEAGAPAPEAGGDAAEPAEATQDESAARTGSLPYPALRTTGASHDADTVRTLAAELAAEAREAVSAGLPPDAFSFYEAFDPDAPPPQLRRALRCAGRGLEQERSLVPFVIDVAAWEGTPAYVASFLAGPTPSAPYDRVQILVVDRGSCGLLHFARQML